MRPDNLRAVASTRYSITVAWNWSEPGATGSEGELPRASGDPEEEEPYKSGADEVSFVLEMKDKLFGWTAVYSGYKTRVDVGSLQPGHCFLFRVRAVSGTEGGGDWSEPLYAATKDEAVSAAHLFRAVENSRAANAKRIIALRPALLHVPDKFGRTPLERAISRNDTHMAALLLGHGADVARKEVGSWRTPLMMAAYGGHLDMVRILVEKGSSWEDTDRSGLTALNYAVDNSHLDVVEFAVSCGADVNARDAFGWSPLMRAVLLAASARVVAFLVDSGARVDEADQHLMTPLMAAAMSGKPELVKFLLSQRADPERENVFGHTALDVSAISGDKEMHNLARSLLAPATDGAEEEPGIPRDTRGSGARGGCGGHASLACGVTNRKRTGDGARLEGRRAE